MQDLKLQGKTKTFEFQEQDQDSGVAYRSREQGRRSKTLQGSVDWTFSRVVENGPKYRPTDKIFFLNWRSKTTMTVGINPPISLIVKNQKQFKACLKSFTRRPYFKLKATMFRPKLGLNEFVTLHRRQTSKPFMLHVHDFKLRECRLNYSNSFMTFCSLHTQNRNKLQRVHVNILGYF